MDFTSSKNNNNASENNTENTHQIVDSSDSYNVKETEERQSRELKAGLHPLKVLQKKNSNYY